VSENEAFFVAVFNINVTMSPMNEILTMFDFCEVLRFAPIKTNGLCGIASAERVNAQIWILNALNLKKK
jgi:hypothetical protein